MFSNAKEYRSIDWLLFSSIGAGGDRITHLLPVTFTSKKFEKDVYYNPYSTTDNLDPEGREFFQLLYCCNITLFKKKLYCRSRTIGAFRT
jgi:hypothetical protein